MTSTIENIDYCIIVKINNIKNILNIYNSYELELYDQADISRSIDDINEIDELYTLSSINLLSEYFLLNKLNDKINNVELCNKNNDNENKNNNKDNENKNNNKDTNNKNNDKDNNTNNKNNDKASGNNTNTNNNDKASGNNTNTNNNDKDNNTNNKNNDKDNNTNNKNNDKCDSRNTKDNVDGINQNNNEDKIVNEKKKKIYLRYVKFINKENLLGKINRIYNKCIKLTKIYSINDHKLKQYINSFNKTNININIEENVTMVCISCNSEMIISSRASEKICNNCGYTEPLFGIISDEEQICGGNNEAQKQKHGKYDPTKHCKYWLDCIQAEEKKDIPEKILNNLLSRIKQDKQIIPNITCDMYRKYLKDISQTRYNDHVPLIRKKLSGISPPQLSDVEKKIISLYFTEIVHIFNKIKPNINSNNKSNCPYHPYFIYKIIEHILKDPIHKIRKKEILSCIHLQSRETLIDNDIIMSMICKHMPEFTYKPTII